MQYQVKVTRYTAPPELTTRVEFTKNYKTENGARQYLLRNFDFINNKFQKIIGDDQLIARIGLDFSK